jgi:hypothetical protein
VEAAVEAVDSVAVVASAAAVTVVLAATTPTLTPSHRRAVVGSMICQ